MRIFHKNPNILLGDDERFTSEVELNIFMVIINQIQKTSKNKWECIDSIMKSDVF